MSLVVLRYFKTRKNADAALSEIRKIGFKGQVIEDEFLGFPLSYFKVPRRFKLLVDRTDYFKIAETLAKKLKK